MARGLTAPRRVGALVGALALGATALGLSACGGGTDAASEGHRACLEIHKSIALYDKATSQPSATARATRAKALVELRDALSPAALAASNDTAWQALAATLSESSHVGEGQLITALRDQCTESLKAG